MHYPVQQARGFANVSSRALEVHYKDLGLTYLSGRRLESEMIKTMARIGMEFLTSLYRCLYNGILNAKGLGMYVVLLLSQENFV